MAGARYRHNVSHNAGVIYHEYGHHLSRHTADFRANAQARAGLQNNLKTPLDEGYCDYWAATMLDVPHIWVWHRSHLVAPPHARSLTSTRTFADYDHARAADPHVNGTIWAAALWDLRTRLGAITDDGPRRADQLVLQSLLELGRMTGLGTPTRTEIRWIRAGLSAGLAALLRADEHLHGGAFRTEILATLGRRGIVPPEQKAAPMPRGHDPHAAGDDDPGAVNGFVHEIPRESPLLMGVRRHVGLEAIPESRDLLSGAALEARLAVFDEPPLSMIAVGDVLLGARTTPVIARHGADHLFSAVAPLLRRAPVVLGNLEGPFAERAARAPRNHSYRVRPDLAPALVRAGFNVMTLANNHLMDCGRAGVLETLHALDSAGIAAVGAGVNRVAAHRPAVVRAGSLRVGVLGYYWNRRTSATSRLPGSAMDPPEALQADIARLRATVDRVVVTFHWGVPYERDPSSADRDKARLAIDLGADAVIGHHPHVIQPFEVYRGCPIFYSVGNFAFGSGNSRAEGLLVALRFDEERTRTEIYPLYVKNRDPRIDYQPKVMCGEAGMRCLSQLASMSGGSGALLTFDRLRGVLDLPWTRRIPEGSLDRGLSG
jgi:poly-gamma-glutamate capsule biosynthesis protein CapA/YwtB (metallophosphatase superfamily)